jgi:hypothetical protein
LWRTGDVSNDFRVAGRRKGFASQDARHALVAFGPAAGSDLPSGRADVIPLSVRASSAVAGPFSILVDEDHAGGLERGAGGAEPSRGKASRYHQGGGRSPSDCGLRAPTRRFNSSIWSTAVDSGKPKSLGFEPLPLPSGIDHRDRHRLLTCG